MNDLVEFLCITSFIIFDILFNNWQNKKIITLNKVLEQEKNKLQTRNAQLAESLSDLISKVEQETNSGTINPISTKEASKVLGYYTF